MGALLSGARKAYRSTAAEAWFQDAEVMAKLRKGVATFQARGKVKRPTPSQVRQMHALIERTADRMKTHEFKGQARALVGLVQMRNRVR